MGLSGNLESFSVPEILQLLALQRKSGILRLTHSDGERQVLFIERGRIVGTRDKCPPREDALVIFLLGAGFLTPEQVGTIERVQKETGKDSLYIILSGGMVGRDRLVEAITQHTQKLVDHLLTWTRGTYEFQGDERAIPRQALKHPLSIEEMLMEGMRRLDELATIKQAVLAPDLHLLRSPDPLDRARLSREQLVVYDLVAESTSVETLVARSPLGEYSTYEVISGLLETGTFVVDPCPPPDPVSGQPAPMDVVVPGATRPHVSAWAGLVGLTVASLLLGAALGPMLHGHARGLLPRTVAEARRRMDVALAREVFQARRGRAPQSVDELVSAGLIDARSWSGVPQDAPGDDGQGTSH